MRALSTVNSAAGAGSPLVLDPRGAGPVITVQLVVTGTNTSTVQVTLDNVFDPAYVPASGNWFSIPVAALVGATASQIANLPGPYTAVRLNTTAFTSGTASLRVMQSSGRMG